MAIPKAIVHQWVGQCCQEAEISAKKLIRSRGKIKLAGRICSRILAEFYQKRQKRGQRIFSKEDPYLMVLTHFQRQRNNFNYITTFRIDPLCMLNWRFCQIGTTFSKIGRTFLMYWPENNFKTWILGLGLHISWLTIAGLIAQSLQDRRHDVQWQLLARETRRWVRL